DERIRRGKVVELLVDFSEWMNFYSIRYLNYDKTDNIQLRERGSLFQVKIIETFNWERNINPMRRLLMNEFALVYPLSPGDIHVTNLIFQLVRTESPAIVHEVMSIYNDRTTRIDVT
ncbi:hypothetical protein PV326_012634, partial [Microctonus aethiopoides]